VKAEAELCELIIEALFDRRFFLKILLGKRFLVLKQNFFMCATDRSGIPVKA
jgi:hypothetical protein